MEIKYKKIIARLSDVFLIDDYFTLDNPTELEQSLINFYVDLSTVGVRDKTIGSLISELKSRNFYDHINIIITTDHGMTTISQDSVIFLDDYINLDDVEIVDWGPASAILPKVEIDDIFSKLIDAHPKLDVYKKGELPDELHYSNHRRIQPIIAIAHEHWSISDRNTYNLNPSRYNGGNHGYYSSYESMNE